MEPNEPAQEKNGIALLVPVGQSIPGLFLASFGKALSAALSRGIATTFFVADKAPLEAARQMLLMDALSLSPSLRYVLWMDADMKLDERHVLGLYDFLESHPEADAASALYFRKEGFEPLCFTGPFEEQGRMFMRFFMPQTQEPAPADAAGLGCMMIRTSSLSEKLVKGDKMKKLFWFDNFSEDINFCLAMKEAGMRLFVLPSLVVPHMGGAVSLWHYSKKREEQGKR
jgi:GT2 family glycosyltransferase